MNSMFERHKTREYKGHKEKVHTVAWNSDGRRIASGSVDKTARVWNPHRVNIVLVLVFFFSTITIKWRSSKKWRLTWILLLFIYSQSSNIQQN